MEKQPRLRVTGWGPVSFPWEKKRRIRSYEETRRLLDLTGNGAISEESEDNPTTASSSTEPLRTASTSGSGRAVEEPSAAPERAHEGTAPRRDPGTGLEETGVPRRSRQKGSEPSRDRASRPVPDSRVGKGQVDSLHKLEDELGKLDEQLEAMVEAFMMQPNVVDSSIDHVTRIIGEVYRSMRSGLFADDSLLRQDNETWEAVQGQQEEVFALYQSALEALDILREIVEGSRSYSRREQDNLQQIQRNAQVFAEQRWKAIEAVRYFHLKFSVILDELPASTATRSATRPPHTAESESG